MELLLSPGPNAEFHKKLMGHTCSSPVQVHDLPVLQSRVDRKEITGALDKN